MAKSVSKSTKSAGSKSDKGKETGRIKYEDKSTGQPDMVIIFEEIRKLMKPYERGTIRMHGGEEGKLLLISEKEVEIEGRKRKDVWFASALIQKGFVGFYFMPVYMNNPVERQLKPELLKCLK